MQSNPQIQPPHAGCLLIPPREASAVQAEKLPTDDVSVPRIQASLLNGYSTLYSCIISKITFVCVKMVDSINYELTVVVFKLAFCVKNNSEALPEFWAN